MDVQGMPVNRTDFAGPLLIDFMGTWCTPCQRAVPVLKDLQAAYPNLAVVSVSSTDSAGALQDFQARHDADWPHIVDDGSLVRAYREAGSNAPSMMWPSYALVIENELVFYNRGETLPATFTTAIDRHVAREAPEFEADALVWVGASVALGAAAWFSPWLQAIVLETPRRRPAASAAIALGLAGGLGALAAFASRPLSGRVATVAPFLAAIAVAAVIWWWKKGARTPRSKRLDGDGWTHAWALHGQALWYTAPVWGALLHVAMLRTAPWESLLIVAGFGLGTVLAEQMVQRWRARLQAWPMGRVGAGALLFGAAINGVLYLR